MYINFKKSKFNQININITGLKLLFMTYLKRMLIQRNRYHKLSGGSKYFKLSQPNSTCILYTHFIFIFNSLWIEYVSFLSS
jgi:hypothetical protein